MAEKRALMLTDDQYATLCCMVEHARVTFDSDMAHQDEEIEIFDREYNDIVAALECFGIES